MSRDAVRLDGVLRLGTTVLGDDVAVLADTEGNRFCIVDTAHVPGS